MSPPARLLLTTGATAFAPVDRADWRIWFYLAAQLVGGAGLSLLLVTMLWPTKKRKPRNPVLISLCLSWWLSAFPCLLILYYARQVTGPPPAHNVCLASAVLTMSQSILVAMTAPALIFHIWLVLQTAIGAKFSSDGLIRRSTLVCLLVPWTTYIVFALAILAVGLREPARVHRALFYCIVDDAQLTETIGIVGTLAMVAAIVLEVWTLALLHRNRACIRQLSRDGRGVDVSLVLRVCVFGVYVFLGLCLNVYSIFNWTSPVPDLFFSTFGVAVFLVFATQPDIWRLWRDASRTVASRASKASFGAPEHAAHARASGSVASCPAPTPAPTSTTTPTPTGGSARGLAYPPVRTAGRGWAAPKVWRLDTSASASASTSTSATPQQHTPASLSYSDTPTHPSDTHPPRIPTPAALRAGRASPGWAALVQAAPEGMYSVPVTPTSTTVGVYTPALNAYYEHSHHERDSCEHDRMSPVDPRGASQRSLIPHTPADTHTHTRTRARLPTLSSLRAGRTPTDSPSESTPELVRDCAPAAPTFLFSHGHYDSHAHHHAHPHAHPHHDARTDAGADAVAPVPYAARGWAPLRSVVDLRGASAGLRLSLDVPEVRLEEWSLSALDSPAGSGSGEEEVGVSPWAPEFRSEGGEAGEEAGALEVPAVVVRGDSPVQGRPVLERAEFEDGVRVWRAI